jgi:signal transduction histidine kinase
VLTVADTGIGIPAAALDRIFERFYRVDKGRARDEGGTGLGLAIVKHVAQAHGGTVEVDSRPGHGSTFRVRLPAADCYR